jgi:hypothetical protein
MTTPTPTVPPCLYCPHPVHPKGEKCSQCKCKGKPGWFKSMLGGLGNAVGESLFGGNR